MSCLGFDLAERVRSLKHGKKKKETDRFYLLYTTRIDLTTLNVMHLELGGAGEVCVFSSMSPKSGKDNQD